MVDRIGRIGPSTDGGRFGRSWRSENRPKSGDLTANFGDIFAGFSSNSSKSHQIWRDLAKSSEDSMDLAEILPKMAEISPDVNNFAGKCRDLDSVGFLRVLKRKPASRPAVFGFWRPRSAAERRNDRVGRFRIGRRSDPPGGSGLGWVWTALILRNFICGILMTCMTFLLL